MGTFQPNRRRTQTPFPQPQSRTQSTHNPSQIPNTLTPTPLPTPVPTSTSRPILRSTPNPQTLNKKLTPPKYPLNTRSPHNIKAIDELDKLINFLLAHRPHVAALFVNECWLLYKDKHSSKVKNALNNTQPTHPPANPQHPQNLPSSDVDTVPTSQPRPDQSSLPPQTHANGSTNHHTPSSPPQQPLVSLPNPSRFSDVPLLAQQSTLENLVYKRWKNFISKQRTVTKHSLPDNGQYVICEPSKHRKTPILLDPKRCCMALLDSKSNLSDVHLKALRFLWYHLIEDTCTGAVFNHGIGFPRTHIIYLFAQLVMNSPDRAKSKILIVCPRASEFQWEMATEPFDVHIEFLTIQHWQDNINHWRARGGVLVASDQAFYNVVSLSPSADKQAALAALCCPDICVLDEASRTNIKVEMPLVRHFVGRARTKSRLALTSLPLAGFITRAWSIVNWACPGLFGTKNEYQRRFVLPIVQGHKRTATLDDGKVAFEKACLLYNKMGMVTFTVDSAMRKEALLSNGVSLHESVIWVNLSREEYALYRDVERCLSKAVRDEHLSPYIATDLLICAASSLHALERTLQTWAEATPQYLESIGHRSAFTGHQEPLVKLRGVLQGRVREDLPCTKLILARMVGRECLKNEERLVIFASSQELFDDVYRFLHSELGGGKVHSYDGASDAKVRNDAINDFNTAPEGAVLIAPYGPTFHCMEDSGWGFVNATRALFIDSSWHSGACVQAVNRVHNFAQLNSEAHVHHFLARGTVDYALSSVLDWRRQHMSSCESSTLPETLSEELDERGFLVAPEVSSFWIRENPPEELSRSGLASINRSGLREDSNSSCSKEHSDLILPLRETLVNATRDTCVHEIILNSDRHRCLSENLDLWMRSEWSRHTRYLTKTEDELERKGSVKSFREGLHTFGEDGIHDAERREDNGGWVAGDRASLENDSLICHLLSSWEPYRRLYEPAVEMAEVPPLNEDRGEKRSRPHEGDPGNSRTSRRRFEA